MSILCTASPWVHHTTHAHDVFSRPAKDITLRNFLGRTNLNILLIPVTRLHYKSMGAPQQLMSISMPSHCTHVSITAHAKTHLSSALLASRDWCSCARSTLLHLLISMQWRLLARHRQTVFPSAVCSVHPRSQNMLHLKWGLFHWQPDRSSWLG